LTNYKNYESQTMDFSPVLNCLVGLNGVGKTNVLDAIHFLCLCKSHTGLNDRNLIRHDESFFRLEGRFDVQGSGVKIVAKYQAGQRKEIERNEVPYGRLADYIGQFPVVMIAPDDVSLVQEGSEDRRRFLDTTLSQISSDYLQNLLTYNAIIKQRNALLKLFAEHRRYDAALLESLDQQLPAPAKILFENRKQFVERFAPLFAEYYAEISGSREQVAVQYESDLEGHSFASLLEEVREKDRVLQRSTVGPHKDDLRLLMDGQLVKKFASQGQLKSFLLALRLAQYDVLRQEKELNPILLLDDIFDKLDAHRVRHLVGLLIRRAFGQTFITDTQLERLQTVVKSYSSDYTMFVVERVNGLPTVARK
ncbi:MAG TPA: DNA replication and repair protein RecF, partial [Saprospirales bacterium]|nr:DNA replication and repair protein RecF [Saprospirales bacterium]